MVLVSNCTPWSDIKCISESAANSTGKTPAAEGTVTTSPGTPASPFTPTVITVFTVVSLLVLALVILAVAGFVRKTSLWKKVLSCRKSICPDRPAMLQPCPSYSLGVAITHSLHPGDGVTHLPWTSLEGAGDDRSGRVLGTLKLSPGCGLEWVVCLPKVFFWRSCPSRGPEAEDNVCNEDLSNRESQHTQVPEQEIEGQELRELTGVTVQSPEEPQHLLGQAEAKGCRRRRLQLPVNDADPTESKCFVPGDTAGGQGTGTVSYLLSP
ncbi:hypothetical protein P7K49_027561 [Saguinus oedipus]|uniref:Tumor necrosis factor receptor superfamily member 13C n=1 Tax=Saguinus oedipus TaxID=9490 RepID=A0ABQ9U9U6_SAGOE|nr:hypothetical protein P7K49_027561 [Saguinus oedipus]